MKRNEVMSYLLFSFVALLPVGVIFSFCIGCRFELVNYNLFAVVPAVISIVVVILNIVSKENIENKRLSRIYALLAFFSILNAFVYSSKEINILIIICIVITIGCCLFLSGKYGKSDTLRVTSIVVSAILILPLCLYCAVYQFLGGLVCNTVIRTIKSPDQLHCAVVIDVDQGALGGNTVVDIYSSLEFNVLLFRIYKKPDRVYIGEWREYEDMDIYWKNDDCLVINSDRCYI